VHGSAPALTGKGIANPIAAVLTGGLMFDHSATLPAAAELKRAVRTVAGGSRPHA